MSQKSEEERGKAEGEIGEKPAGNFETSDGLSDIILIVEGKKLYVHKILLARNSPVFRQMFSTPNFREGTASEIPLPGKTLQAFVNFLNQVYPETNKAPIQDDTLEDMLALADEYQVDFLVDKCREYFKQQVSKGDALAVEQTLMYLHLCDKYSHHLAFWDDFLKVAVSKNYQQVKGNKFFQLLPDARRVELLGLRCEQLESIKISQENTKDKLEKHRNQIVSFISRVSTKLEIKTEREHYSNRRKQFCDSADDSVCENCEKQKRDFAENLQSDMIDLGNFAKRDISQI